MAFKFSPLQVRNQEFAKSMRGYRPDEVKQFLTQVADFINELLQEERSLKNEVETLTRRTIELERNANAIKEMIDERAQKLMNSARQQAEKLLLEAEREREKILKEVGLNSEKKREELYELTGIYEAYKRQLLYVLEGVFNSVKKFEESVENRTAQSAVEKIGPKIGILQPINPITAIRNTVHRRRRAFFLKPQEE